MLMFFFGGFKFKHEANDPVEESHGSLVADICFVVFALLNCVWSTAYIELWKRRQAELAFKWGTYELQIDPFLNDPRPGFK
ncbi:Protein ANOH-2 a, partial [Aphelenchoides avenae]